MPLQPVRGDFGQRDGGAGEVRPPGGGGAGPEDHEGLCAKFTLQMFRGRPLLNELGRSCWRGARGVCREAGVIRSPKVRAALDTSPIIGRGAVKDTYNLVADGIGEIVRALSAFETPLLQAVDVPGYAASLDLSRYFSDTSLKGGVSLDWNEESERVVFLNELVADVRRAQRAAEAALAAADSGTGFDALREAL